MAHAATGPRVKEPWVNSKKQTCGLQTGYKGSGDNGGWELESSAGKGAGSRGVELSEFRGTTRSVAGPPKPLLFFFFLPPRPLLPALLDSFKSSPCSGESLMDASKGLAKDPNSEPLANAAATPSGERNSSTAGISRARETDVTFPSSSS